MVTTLDYTVARFSSRTLPEQWRGAAIATLYERGLLLTRFSPCGDVPPQVDVVSRSVPGLRILTATYAGVRHESMPPKAGQSGGDDVSFCMILSGRSLATRGTQELVLGDGDGVLVSSDEAAWAFASPSSVKVAGLRLPRSALASLVPDLDEALMRRVPGNAGALALLRKYLEIVADDPALGVRDSQRLIAGHLYDLTALALGTTRDGEALARRRTLGAARLAGIKANIVANLQDGDLDATTVAARNRLSVRYLHKLFQNDGLTYSEFVLGQRLARAHAILRHPLHSGRTISAIAFDVGFNDLSYFNRAFRRRYGATPSDIRCSGDVLAI